MALDPADVALAAELSGVSTQELANELDNVEQREMMRGDEEQRAAIREETQRKAEKRIRREYAAHQGVSEQELQNEADLVNAVDMMRGGDDEERAAVRQRTQLQDEEREQAEYAAHRSAQEAEDRVRSAALKRGADSEGGGEASKVSRVDKSKKRDKLDEAHSGRKKMVRSDRAEDTPMPHAPPPSSSVTDFGERALREQRKQKRDENRKKRKESKAAAAAGKQEKQESITNDGLHALVKAAENAGMEVVDIKVEEPTRQAERPVDMEIPPHWMDIPKPPVIYVAPPVPTSDSAPPPEVPEFIYVPVPHPITPPAHIPAPPIIAPPPAKPAAAAKERSKKRKNVKFATAADDNTMPAAPPVVVVAAPTPSPAPSSANTAMPEVPAFGPMSLDQHILKHPAMKASHGTPVLKIEPATPPAHHHPPMPVTTPVKLIQKHYEPHVSKARGKKATTNRPTHSPASTYEKVDWEEKRRVAEAQIKAYEEKMKLLKQESDMAAQPTRPPAAAAAVHSQPSEEYPHAHHRHNQLVVVHNPRRGWIGDDDEGMPEVPGHLPRVVTTTTTKSY